MKFLPAETPAKEANNHVYVYVLEVVKEENWVKVVYT